MAAVCKAIIVYLVPTLSPSLLRRPEDDEDVSSISSYHTETPRSRPSTPVDAPRGTPIDIPHKAPPIPEICTPQAPHDKLLPPKPATAVPAKPSSPPITPRANSLDVSPLHQETRPEDPLKEKKLKLIRALLRKKPETKAQLLDEATRKGNRKTQEEITFAQSLRSKDDAELKSLAYEQLGEVIL